MARPKNFIVKIEVSPFRVALPTLEIMTELHIISSSVILSDVAFLRAFQVEARKQKGEYCCCDINHRETKIVHGAQKSRREHRGQRSAHPRK